MIEVQQVKKQYEKDFVLHDVNIHVKKGSIYGLLGSNGAGKTTLLKTIVGIYRPDGGEVRIDGEEVHENLSIKKRILFLTDNLYFFSHYTVEQMAAFYKEQYPTWNEERFSNLLQSFQFQRNGKIHKFSKGMQRQIAFIYAFSCMPDVLVLDEPIDGLDPVVRQKIKNILVQEVAEREMTVIISSHNLREIEDICDHIGILHKGKLIIEKDLDELKSDIHKIQVAYKDDEPEEMFAGMNVLYKEKRGSVFLCIVRGEMHSIVSQLKATNPVLLDILPLTLEEIFIYEMGDIGYDIGNILV